MILSSFQGKPSQVHFPTLEDSTFHVTSSSPIPIIRWLRICCFLLFKINMMFFKYHVEYTVIWSNVLFWLEATMIDYFTDAWRNCHKSWYVSFNFLIQNFTLILIRVLVLWQHWEKSKYEKSRTKSQINSWIYIKY